MSQHIELARFTVKPEVVEEFLARRPAMLDTMRRRYPGFASAHLARLDGDTWVDVLFWDDIEQCHLAMAEVADIPDIAEWLALIDEVVSMEEAPLVEPIAADAGAAR
jgi:hypothetical protein